MAPTTKLKNALKSAARLPVRVAGRSNSNNHGFNPQPNEVPLVTLRIQVLGCNNLMAKDKNGSSDPFVVVSVLNARQQTPVIKRNLNPIYATKDATFDFPIYASLADRLGAVEFVVWDKDMVGKDYLGEVAIPIDSWFTEGTSLGFEDSTNQPRNVDLVSGRTDKPVSGTIQVKIGFIAQPTSHAGFDEILHELVQRSRPSLVSVPPTEGVGTIRSTSKDGRPDLRLAFEDDGGISSDEEDDDDTEAEDDDTVQHHETHHGPLSASPKEISYFPEERRAAKLPPPPELNLQPASPIAAGNTPTQANTFSSITPTSGASTVGGPTPVASPAAAVSPSPSVPKSASKKIFSIPIPRRLSGLTSASSSSPSLQAPPSPGPPSDAARDPVTGEILPGTPGPLTPNTERTRRQKVGDKIRRSWGGGSTPGTPNLSDSGLDESALSGAEGVKSKRKGKSGRAYSLDSGNDILGIVMLEILRAEDLPKLKNMTRTGWDMDPFIVCSFGKKVFRTRIIRHSLNPQWDEKLLFHVRKYETSFRVQMSVHDWDKMSSNDYIGDAGFEVRELIDKAPQKDPETGLYAKEEAGEHDMIEYKLPVEAKETSVEWESKHRPVVYVRAKYQPYELLRQKFWRQYLKQYDTDDTGKISYIELTAMLDSLGSTLTKETTEGFWRVRGKDPRQDELSFDELIILLEEALGKPDSERRRIDEGGTSTAPTPSNAAAAAAADKPLDLENLNFSGPQHIPGSDSTEPSVMPISIPPSSSSGSAYSSSYSSDDNDFEEDPTGAYNAPMTPSTVGAVPVNPPLDATPKKKSKFKRGIRKAKKATSGGSSDDSDESVERVINVKNCPFCHRPRLSSKAEVDIITHLAVCASGDWNKVDQIMVGNFVTASQAQRKWYTKIIGKVSSGDYRLGANSANIIVQNRLTGQLEEEKMQVYVRLGIRLLYKGATSRMEGGRARRLLKSMSIKQGVKYDSPSSAEGIVPFIQFHNLDMDEVLDPLDSFKTFNEFFYRKLKPDARPVEQPDNPYRLVSSADCRLMAFSTVDDATRLWIKGREFTVPRLLGDAYKHEAERYMGGALVIFRLAPQDYHRFHSPVDGKIGPMTFITGEYYTVNPQAIRSSLDVYGENVRKIVPIDSPYFGRVMAVCIGAMMVGSIKTTVQEGQEIKRGEEFGYFAFGGSTIVCLFEKGAVEWDEDLLANGRASLETLVRVGMGIGTGRKDRNI